MESIILKGKAIPKFDQALMVFLGMPKAESMTEESIRRFGIENGEGEIYRIVGAENDQVYNALIKRLRDLRYRIEPLPAQGYERFRAVARVPPEL